MSDSRPGCAVGHVFMRAAEVPAAVERLVAVGVRPIVRNERFAVLELRGGTHIVVQQLEEEEGVHELAFDLMFEDLPRARERFVAAGFEVSEISSGKIHDGFTASAPERFSLRAVDSHVGARAV